MKRFTNHRHKRHSIYFKIRFNITVATSHSFSTYSHPLLYYDQLHAFFFTPSAGLFNFRPFDYSDNIRPVVNDGVP